MLVTPAFLPGHGGIQRLLGGIVAHTTRLTVRVIAPSEPGADDFDAAQDYAVRRTRRSAHHKATLAELSRVIVADALAERPDALWSGHVVASPAAVLAARLLRVPLVQHVHALELRHFPALAGWALPRAARIIAVSRYSAELAAQAGACEQDVRIVHPGVELPPEGPRAVDQDAPTILTVARMDERYKGHDVMLRALPLVRARVPNVRWVALGDGVHRPALEDLAAALGVADVTHFMGFVPERERTEWMRRGHVLAMPSRIPPGSAGEGFGIAFLEASAHGLPVVAGAVGGALDAVADGETGLLVDPIDHVAVADALCAVLLDPERAKRFGRAGRAKASRHAWPLAAAAVEDVFQNLDP